VGVAYGTSPERVADVLLGVARKHSHVLAEPAPVVLFRGFGDSALLFEMRVWTNRFDTWPQTRSELAIGAYAVLREAGIEIPFPQQDVHVRPA
jgi:small-conductance mechanosensitive channel